MLKHSIDDWMNIIKVANPPAQRMFEQWYNSPAYIENTEIRNSARTILENWSTNEGSFTPQKEDYERDKWDRFFIHLDIHNSARGQRREEGGNIRTRRFANHAFISAGYTTITFMDGIKDAWNLSWQVQTIFTPTMDADNPGRLEENISPPQQHRGWPGPDNDYENDLGLANEIRRGKFTIQGAQYLSLQIRGTMVNENFKRPVYFCTGWHDMMTIVEQGNLSDFTTEMCNSSFIAISESGAKTENQSEGVNICVSPAPSDSTNGDLIVVGLMNFGSCKPLEYIRSPGGMIDFGSYTFITNILGGMDEEMVERYLENANEQQTDEDGMVQHDLVNDFIYGVLYDKFDDTGSPYNEIMRPAGDPISEPTSGMRAQIHKIKTIYETRSYDCFVNQWKKFGINWQEEDTDNFKILAWVLTEWPGKMDQVWRDSINATEIMPDEVANAIDYPIIMSEASYNRLIEIHNELSCNDTFDAPPYTDRPVRQSDYTLLSAATSA